MKNEYLVSLSFDVVVDLHDFGGEEITEQDILNAFGAEERELSDPEVKYFIEHCLEPEDLFDNGSLQKATVMVKS